MLKNVCKIHNLLKFKEYALTLTGHQKIKNKRHIKEIRGRLKNPRK